MWFDDTMPFPPEQWGRVPHRVATIFRNCNPHPTMTLPRQANIFPNHVSQRTMTHPLAQCGIVEFEAEMRFDETTFFPPERWAPPTAARRVALEEILGYT